MSVDQRRQNDVVVSCLRSAIVEGAAGLSDVPGLLKRIILEDMWRERVVQETGEIAPFKQFNDFVRTKPLEGLGTDIKTLERLCADDKEALGLLTQATTGKQGARNDIVNNVNYVDSPEGNSTAYALRKLQLDAPELHKQVIAGDLSPHAAMVEAGFRKKTVSIPVDDVRAIARALVRHLTVDQLEELTRILVGG